MPQGGRGRPGYGECDTIGSEYIKKNVIEAKESGILTQLPPSCSIVQHCATYVCGMVGSRRLAQQLEPLFLPSIYRMPL